MVTGSTRFRLEFDSLITCLNCSPITEGSISILKLMGIWMWISITPSRMSGSSWDRPSIRRSATRKEFCEPDTFSCPWMRRWAWRRSTFVAVLPSQWIPRYVFGSSAICKPNLCTTSSKALRGELAPTCTLAFCTDGRITTRSNHCSRRLLARCEPRAGEIRAWPNSFPVRKACYDDRNRRLWCRQSDVGEEGTELAGTGRRHYLGCGDGFARRHYERAQCWPPRRDLSLELHRPSRIDPARDPARNALLRNMPGNAVDVCQQ